MEVQKQKLIRSYYFHLIIYTVLIPCLILGSAYLLPKKWGEYFALAADARGTQWIQPVALTGIALITVLLLFFMIYLPLLRDLPSVRKQTFPCFEGRVVGSQSTDLINGGKNTVYQDLATGEKYALETQHFPKGTVCRVCCLKHAPLGIVEKLSSPKEEET